MMHHGSFVQPPGIAVRLVDLFTPEAIRGDLLEEFSEVALKSGPALARRWYWRQCVKTIAYMMVEGCRVAPWSIAGGALGGLLVGYCGNRLTQEAAWAMLSRYDVNIYAHVEPFAYWLIYDVLVVRIMIPVLMGWAAALVAKEREMVGAVALSVLVGTLSAMSLLLTARSLAAHHVFKFPRGLPMALLFTTFVSPVMIAIGGAIGRRFRAGATH